MDMHIRTPITLGLVALSMLAAACSPLAPGASGLNLEGRAFVATKIEGRALVPGSSIQLTFEQGSLGATAGCNSMGGSYVIEGGRLTVRELVSTEMACDPPLMDQERWLANLLTGGATISLDGNALVLEGGGTRLTLIDRRVANPDRPIQGTRWVLEGIVSADSVSSVPADVTASLRIIDGRTEVEAGCNQGGGTVEIEATTLTFGGLALTKMACDADRAGVERAMVSTLSGRVDYRVDADVLTLRKGNDGLLFRAAP
jgi:heat shock protein HslJ